MKKFFESLRVHALKIIDFKKKQIKLLTHARQNSYQNSKICCICKESFEDKYKKCYKVRGYCHQTGEYRDPIHSISNLKYSVREEIPIVFHNEYDNDYHFVRKELAEEYEK